MTQTKKLRDVGRTGRASIVVDDVLPPCQPRMIEIRGSAEIVGSGGKAFGDNFEDAIVRIHPTRIIAFGIDSDEPRANARSVGGQASGDRPDIVSSCRSRFRPEPPVPNSSPVVVTQQGRDQNLSTSIRMSPTSSNPIRLRIG
jgi:hypothetical protein